MKYRKSPKESLKDTTLGIITMAILTIPFGFISGSPDTIVPIICMWGIVEIIVIIAYFCKDKTGW